ncbi:MAG: hypothetical protein ACE5K4_12070 [Candidatus Hydrothermarchaeota archaeon]
MNAEISQVLAEINKKLDELVLIKQEISELKKKIEVIEELVIEELSDEEKKELEETLEEYRKKKTIPLKKAEKILEIE